MKTCKLLIALAILFHYQQWSQTISSYTSAGTYTWTCPQGVDSVFVECWGSGGGGGGVSLYLCALGTVGGGGGAYSKTKLSVIPGQNYTVVVGAGANGGLASGSNGFNGVMSRFIYQGNNVAFAAGGNGGGGIIGGNCWYGNQAGQGGSAGTGTIYYGGNGSPGNAISAGGGGGSGGINSNGGNGAISNGGVAGLLGGNGGNGGGPCANPCSGIGQQGLKPGGGGGGTYVSNTQNGSLNPINTVGGKGADGQVIISQVKGIWGYIYKDVDSNCILGGGELYLKKIKAVLKPENMICESNDIGIWSFVPNVTGTHTLTFEQPFMWKSACPKTYTFNVTNLNLIVKHPDYGLYNTIPCSSPEISIYAPTFRRCFSNQMIYVKACNKLTGLNPIPNSFVDVELNSYLTVLGSSIPYTSLGNNIYRFQTGSLIPGQCTSFNISTNVSCNANNGRSLCIKASLLAADSCSLDTLRNNPGGPNTGGPIKCLLPWDKSSLKVTGICKNDSVCFTIKNGGEPVNGDMKCFSPVRIYVNGKLTYTDTIKLSGGGVKSFCFPGNGKTWILQADQHPLHPGNSRPNAHISFCGDTTNATPTDPNELPLDDSDPISDTYCGIVRGSFDPNDKTGYPLGLGTDKIIMPNQQIQYFIRFQNTGNDTAFYVKITDTLSTDLDIFSVNPGVSSHPYSFRMYGNRILEWEFKGIKLPDSTINQSASNGFVSFKVNQAPNLPEQTIIKNTASIYFDFNAPIITNTTKHKISVIHPSVVQLKENSRNNFGSIQIYPNPSRSEFYLEVDESLINKKLLIYDIYGKCILDLLIRFKMETINLEKYPSGIYIVKVDGQKLTFKIAKID